MSIKPVAEQAEIDSPQRPEAVGGGHELFRSVQSYRSAGVTIKDSPERNLLRETKLRPGFCLSVMDVKPAEGIRFRYEKKSPLIDFGFVLAGDMRNSVQGISTAKVEVNNRPGRGGVAFLPASEGVVEIPAQQRVQMLHVHVEPRVLHALLEGELDIVPADFKSIIEGGSRDYLCQGELDPAVQAVAYQILNGPRSGIPQRLFLEGKALEFVSLLLAWMGGTRGRQGKRPALSPRERERIHAARALLVENLTAPPTLAELSQRVGLSVNKLCAGFRDLFDTTAYGYLREYQMQKARLLFEEGDLNVSQVAWTVGYVNVSHFSAAYKKRFGILPKAFLQAARRNPSFA